MLRHIVTNPWMLIVMAAVMLTTTMSVLIWIKFGEEWRLADNRAEARAVARA